MKYLFCVRSVRILKLLQRSTFHKENCVRKYSSIQQSNWWFLKWMKNYILMMQKRCVWIRKVTFKFYPFRNKQNYVPLNGWIWHLFFSIVPGRVCMAFFTGHYVLRIHASRIWINVHYSHIYTERSRGDTNIVARHTKIPNIRENKCGWVCAGVTPARVSLVHVSTWYYPTMLLICSGYYVSGISAWSYLYTVAMLVACNQPFYRARLIVLYFS